MRKVNYLWMLFLIFLMAAACTVHIPYDWGTEYRDYRVVLLVQPDDADVLLDGKFIGSAYEFSDDETAIRLRSRNHELVIKKRGYHEESVNLYDYSTSDITIRIKLTRDRTYYGSSKKPAKPAKDEKEVKEVKKGEKEKPAEYTAKTVPEIKPPKTVDEEEAVEKVDAVNVTLEISPTESSIYLNGRFWGISPPNGKIENLRLKPGKYTLEIVKPGYKALKKVLDVKDKGIKISLKLQK